MVKVEFIAKVKEVDWDAMCTLQACGDELPTDVVLNIVEVFSPTRFHFQLKKDWDNLDNLMTDMNIFYSSHPYLDELRVPPNQLRVGMMVAVVWKEDDLWYRVVIRNMESVSTVEIDYIDYGSRTITLKTRLYELVPQFGNLAKMCYVGMLHGIIPLHKKWTCEVSTEFCKLVMNVNDEREIVLNGKVKGWKDTRVELELFDQKGLNIGDALVAEGTALFAGQEDLQVACAHSHGTEELLPVLSSLGYRAVSALEELDGSFPEQYLEEVKSVKKAAIALGVDPLKNSDDSVTRKKYLANKAVGLLINILMEVKPLALTLNESNVIKAEVQEDSGVESKSVHSMYHGIYAPVSSSEEVINSSKSGSCYKSN